MEQQLIRWLRERLPQNDSVVLGPGDDGAVLRSSPGIETVVTTDMLMEGVDFVLAECDPRLVGRKALAVNLSDLAAMAARPTAAFVSLALPRRQGLELAQGLYEGLIPLAQQYQMAVAGGDTNSWDGPLCMSITAIGEVEAGKALLRRGAQPGDDLLVTGSFGGSILGRHLRFEPRVNEALVLVRSYTIHAAIDVSDGLSLDVYRVCQESGCGAVLELASLPISPAAHELSRQDGISPLDHALGDGEDFELVLAIPAAEASRLLGDQPLGVPLTRVGRFVEGQGLFGKDSSGQQHPLAVRGYEHELR